MNLDQEIQKLQALVGSGNAATTSSGIPSTEQNVAAQQLQQQPTLLGAKTEGMPNLPTVGFATLQEYQQPLPMTNAPIHPGLGSDLPNTTMNPFAIASPSNAHHPITATSAAAAAAAQPPMPLQVASHPPVEMTEGGITVQHPAWGPGMTAIGPNHPRAATDGPTRPPPRFAPDADDRSIFVANIPKLEEITHEVLSDFFSDCGEVKTCTILKVRQTQQLRGQAYIEFATNEATGRALDQKNGAVFFGQELHVSKKRSYYSGGRGRGGRGRAGGTEALMGIFGSAMAAILGASAGGRGGRSRGRGFGGVAPGGPPSSRGPPPH